MNEIDKLQINVDKLQQVLKIYQMSNIENSRSSSSIQIVLCCIGALVWISIYKICCVFCNWKFLINN